MRRSHSLLLCLLATKGVLAGPMAFVLDPPAPTPAAAVQLTISQDFPNPCYKTTASFERIGNTINVALVSTVTEEICIQVIAPQSATLDLGRLEEGAYEVHVVWTGAPFGGRDPELFVFHVAPALELSGLDPVCLRFATRPDTIYQVEFSTDLDDWFDLGDPIEGSGAPGTLDDAVTPGSSRFYRVRAAPSPLVDPAGSPQG